MLTADSFLAIFICVSETALLTSRREEFAYLLPSRLADPLHYHLRYPLPATYHNRLFPQIDSDHLNLPAVIRVDGPGAIDQRNPFSQGTTASRANLGLKARGQRHRNTGRYQCALQWR